MAIVIGCIAVLLIWAIYIYNALIKLKNQAQEGWSGIDVQLRRRHNLIPNLIETVKAYAGHEKSVFNEVTELRSQIGKAQQMSDKSHLESALTLGLGKLIAVAENYPDLKANENFQQLQKELASIEDQIQLARRYYNGTVRNFNTMIESFPQVLIARAMAFVPFEYFEIEDDKEREVPQVKFN
jgi:LemA protein